MKAVSTLIELEEISILYQYLYMNEEHFITIDNGLAKLEIRMNENCCFKAKNLNFPSLPDLDYTDMMVVPNLLGIIDQLKNSPPEEFKNEFKSRWEELRAITLANVCLNKRRLKKREDNTSGVL
jgi:hypothetical protein